MSGRRDYDRRDYGRRDRSHNQDRGYRHGESRDRGSIGGGRARGRGRGGGIKRAPPVDIDELNFPGRKDVYHVKATNLVFTKPLTTQYSKMENTEMAREIARLNRDLSHVELPKLHPSAKLKGSAISLVTNHFKLEIPDSKKILRLWHVEFKASTQGKFNKELKVPDKRNIIHNIAKSTSCAIAFDGSQLAVTHEDLLSLLTRDQDVIVDGKTRTLTIRAVCTSQKKPRDVEVIMTKVSKISLEKVLDYINGDTDEKPTDVLQVVDIVLKSQFCRDVASVKGGAMVPRGINLRINANNNLNGGRQCWNSVYQSASISGWKGKLGHVRLPTVTVDLGTTTVIQARPISELVMEHLERKSDLFELAQTLK